MRTFISFFALPLAGGLALAMALKLLGVRSATFQWYYLSIVYLLFCAGPLLLIKGIGRVQLSVSGESAFMALGAITGTLSLLFLVNANQSVVRTVSECIFNAVVIGVVFASSRLISQNLPTPASDA